MPRRSHAHTQHTHTHTAHTHTHTEYPTETTPIRVEAARRIQREKDTKEDRQGGRTQRNRETKKNRIETNIPKAEVGRRRDGATNRGLVSVYRALVSVYREV